MDFVGNTTDPVIQPTDVILVFNFHINYLLFYYMIFILVMFIIFESLSFFILHIILKILKRNIQSYSAQTLKLHRQFSLLLGAQFLSPFIYLFIPVIGAIIGMLRKEQLNKLAVEMFIFGVIFYGYSNSVITVVFVTPFRRHFLDVFIFSWLRPLLEIVRFQNYITPTAVNSAPTWVVTQNNRV